MNDGSERPTSPLATSTLLLRALDPTLGHELAREIATGDEVDAIVITWRLETPMPAMLYERYATLRPG